MPDIDLETITPSAPDATDYKVVRRGSGPYSVALVADAGVATGTLTLYVPFPDQTVAPDGSLGVPFSNTDVLGPTALNFSWTGAGETWLEEVVSFAHPPFPNVPVSVSAYVEWAVTGTTWQIRFVWMQVRGLSVVWESDPVVYDQDDDLFTTLPTQNLPGGWLEGDVLKLRVDSYDDGTGFEASITDCRVSLAVALAAVAAADNWTYVKLTSTVTNSTTTAVSTGLTIGSLAADTHYLFEGMLFLQSSVTTTGARPGLTWPSGTVQESAWVLSPNSATAFASRFWGAPSAAAAAATGIAVANEGLHARLEGQFVTGGSPTGALTVTLTSEIAASEVRMMANSWIRYRTI